MTTPIQLLPEGKHLLPFQVKAVNKMLKFLNSPVKGTYNACEMRLGKTVQTIAAMNALSIANALIICPSIARGVWAEHLKEFLIQSVAPEDIFIVETKKDLDLLKELPHPRFVIVSYDLLSRGDNYKVLLWDWDLLVLDEAHRCLHPDTAIYTENGLKRLKYVVPGDRVWSFCNGELRLNLVSARMSASVDETASRVTLSDGAVLIGLDSHRVLTSTGWKKINELKISDKVQVLREDVRCGISGILQRRKERNAVLWTKLLNVLSKPFSRRYRKNEGKESHETREVSDANDSDTERNWAPSQDTWRKWSENTKSPESYGNSIKSSFPKSKNYFGISYKFREKAKKLSYLLQSGLCCIGNKSSCGSRWWQSSTSFQKTARQEKREETTFARVESIEVYEPTSFGITSRDFIDLTVERDANYIANGIVVHNCKSPGANVTKNVLKHIWPKCRRHIALSGTPCTKNIIDAFTLFNKFLPQVFENFYSFANHFTNVKRTPFADLYLGIKNEEELKKVIYGTFFVRYRRSEIEKDLPPKIYQRIPLPENLAIVRTDTEEKEHQKYLEKLREAFKSGRKLRIPPPISIATTLRRQGEEKVKAIAQIAKEYLDACIPLVIFMVHTEAIATLANELKVFHPVIVQGSTSHKRREAAITAFQDGSTNIFIGQIQAAGVGISLSRGSTVILGEFHYSPAIVKQAVARVEKMNSKKSVHIIYPVVKGSVEDAVIEIMMEKLESLEKAFDV